MLKNQLLILLCLFSLFMASPAQSAAPSAPDAEQELHFLQTLDYDAYLENGNFAVLPEKFDVIIRNGFVQEAAAEIQRLALANLDEDQKMSLAREVFGAYPRMLEYAKPLIEKDFFDYCLVDGGALQQSLAYVFFGAFNSQNTLEDKLKVAAAFRSVFCPEIKKRTTSKDPKETDFLLPYFSLDDVSDHPGIGIPPTIEFTHLPTALPTFSKTPAKKVVKKGKYLIIRKLQGGNIDADYFVDLAMMSALPAEYFPNDLPSVTRLVVVDSKWQQHSTINNIQIYTPKNSISVYEYPSGKLVTKIGDLNQTISGTIMVRKGSQKYFSEVYKVGVCKTIVDWLNKK